jgi:hypothetical protein
VLAVHLQLAERAEFLLRFGRPLAVLEATATWRLAGDEAEFRVVV